VSENNFEKHYRGWHRGLSFIKSGMRIAGCAGAIFWATTNPGATLGFMASMFLLAELIGIIEEL
jgi:hypothetical protein